jgi:hypothetical protein
MAGSLLARRANSHDKSDNLERNGLSYKRVSSGSTASRLDGCGLHRSKVGCKDLFQKSFSNLGFWAKNEEKFFKILYFVVDISPSGG